MTTFNLETALTATTDTKEIAKQKREVKKTFNAFKKSADSAASACQMLFDNFAHCFDGEDQTKPFNLAKKKWFEAIGFKNAETMKNETGLNLSTYFSMLKWGAAQGDQSFTKFNDLRTAYQARPKVKPVKNKPSKAGSGTGDSEATTSKDVDSITATMHPDLLEIMNRLVSTKSYAEQASAALVIDKALAVIEAKTQAKLKVAA